MVITYTISRADLKERKYKKSVKKVSDTEPRKRTDEELMDVLRKMLMTE